MSCQALFQSNALEITSCEGNAANRDLEHRRWPCFEAHFQDDGAYFVHDGPTAVLVDVNHVELRLAGVERAYSRPVISVDRGTSIRVAPQAVAGLVGDGGDASGIVNGVVRVGPRAFGRLRELRHDLTESSDPGSPDVERRAMALIASLVRAMRQARAALPPVSRPTVAARQRAAVEQVREYLAVRVAEHHSLAKIAAMVDYAPHHFARVFRRETGLTVHGYLTELRLRQAVARLDGGAANLSSLALDLGFSSHSHFTTAFRARFGRPPGTFRRVRPR